MRQAVEQLQRPGVKVAGVVLNGVHPQCSQNYYYYYWCHHTPDKHKESIAKPLFDTALVIISRLRRVFNPLTTPGKDHTSHRLVAMGYMRREAILICYLVSAGLGVVALFITQANISEGYIVGSTSAMVGLAALWRLEQVDCPGKQARGSFLRKKVHRWTH